METTIIILLIVIIIQNYSYKNLMCENQQRIVKNQQIIVDFIKTLKKKFNE